MHSKWFLNQKPWNRDHFKHNILNTMSNNGITATKVSVPRLLACEILSWDEIWRFREWVWEQHRGPPFGCRLYSELTTLVVLHFAFPQRHIYILWNKNNISILISYFYKLLPYVICVLAYISVAIKLVNFQRTCDKFQMTKSRHQDWAAVVAGAVRLWHVYTWNGVRRIGLLVWTSWWPDCALFTGYSLFILATVHNGYCIVGILIFVLNKQDISSEPL